MNLLDKILHFVEGHDYIPITIVYAFEPPDHTWTVTYVCRVCCTQTQRTCTNTLADLPSSMISEGLRQMNSTSHEP